MARILSLSRSATKHVLVFMSTAIPQGLLNLLSCGNPSLYPLVLPDPANASISHELSPLFVLLLLC